jgi:hypothetical protein
MDEPIRKLSREELEEKIHTAAEAGRIEFCQTVRVDILEKEIEMSLAALGHPEALVTDESKFGDFIWHGMGGDVDVDADLNAQRKSEQKELDEKMRALHLGGYCTISTKIWEAALLLRGRGVSGG